MAFAVVSRGLHPLLPSYAISSSLIILTSAFVNAPSRDKRALEKGSRESVIQSIALSCVQVCIFVKVAANSYRILCTRVIRKDGLFEDYTQRSLVTHDFLRYCHRPVSRASILLSNNFETLWIWDGEVKFCSFYLRERKRDNEWFVTILTTCNKLRNNNTCAKLVQRGYLLRKKNNNDIFLQDSCNNVANSLSQLI